MDLVRSSGALVALEAASCSRGRDGGQAAHRHRHGRRRLHQPHVPHTGLRDALLCQERLVRSALQKFYCKDNLIQVEKHLKDRSQFTVPNLVCPIFV